MSLPLYLASRSPRRRELLAEAGIRFRVHVPKEGELPAPRSRHRVSARLIVKEISAAKARAAAKELLARNKRSALILSADTLVFHRNKVLGKPANTEEARRMISGLSGKWHEVYTGVTVLRMKDGKTSARSFQVRTRVLFARLSATQIDRYIATKEPLDKAGAYGIQGPGASLVKEVDGSYTNVVGLPLAETIAALRKVGA